MSPSSPQLKFPGLRAALKMIMKIYVGILKQIIHFKILQELPMLSFTSHCKVRFKCQSCSSWLSCSFCHPCILCLLLSCVSSVYLSHLPSLSQYCAIWSMQKLWNWAKKNEIWKSFTNLAKMIIHNHGTAWLVSDCVEWAISSILHHVLISSICIFASQAKAKPTCSWRRPGTACGRGRSCLSPCPSGRPWFRTCVHGAVDEREHY